MENQINMFEGEQSQEMLIQTFGINWYNQLRNYIDTDHFNQLMKRVSGLRKVREIFPDSDEVFKAYRICDYNDIKVVILGQDPYFNGNADGLAFSCKLTLSPSLKQIYNALYEDYGYGFDNPDQLITLDHWAKQGVLLLNTSLTVERDKPLSHKGLGWEYLITETIRNLALYKKNIVWLLWGTEAKKLKDVLIKSPFYKEQLILEASHPVSASYNNSNWVCNHFGKTNEYLKSNNLKEIKWL